MFSKSRILFYLLLASSLAFVAFYSGLLNDKVSPLTLTSKERAFPPKPMPWEEAVRGPNRGLKDDIAVRESSTEAKQIVNYTTTAPTTTTKTDVDTSVLSVDPDLVEVEKTVAKKKEASIRKAHRFLNMGMFRKVMANRVTRLHDTSSSLFSFRSLMTGVDNPVEFTVKHIKARLQSELGDKHQEMEKQPVITMKINPEVIEGSASPLHTIPSGPRDLRIGEPIPANRVRQVLIATTWRSGSSFFGDLLTHYPGTFYSFEPIHYNNYHEEVAKPPNVLLKDIFTCNFEGVNMANYLRHASRHQFLILNHNHRMAKVCQNILPAKAACFLPKLYRKTCSLFPMNLIKTVRFRMSETETFLNDPEMPNFKVIALFRDPRGVMNSRSSMEWCDKDQCADPSTVCDHLDRDVQAAYDLRKKYPGRVHLVRYEDLALQPYEVVDEVLHFLELPANKYVDTYIKTHTQTVRTKKKYDKKLRKTVSVENPFSTYRQSKSTAFAWRSKVHMPFVENLQNLCQKPMDKLGYRPFENKDQVDNMDIDVLVKDRSDVWPFTDKTETTTELTTTTESS